MTAKLRRVAETGRVQVVALGLYTLRQATLTLIRIDQQWFIQHDVSDVLPKISRYRNRCRWRRRNTHVKWIRMAIRRVSPQSGYDRLREATTVVTVCVCCCISEESWICDCQPDRPANAGCSGFFCGLLPLPNRKSAPFSLPCVAAPLRYRWTVLSIFCKTAPPLGRESFRWSPSHYRASTKFSHNCFTVRVIFPTTARLIISHIYTYS